MGNLVIGLLAHVDAGKTTLSEALLYKQGEISNVGRVDNRNTFLDTDAMERKRGITIFSKQARLEIGPHDVTLLDTPGHVDFSAEMERTLQVLDYAILIISGADGVQSHTLTLWKLLTRYQVPTIIFVNKMDQRGTDRKQTLEELQNRLSGSIIDFSKLPIRIWEKGVSGLPETFAELAEGCPEERLEEFSEAVSLCEEEMLNGYLEEGEIRCADIARVITQRKLYPCFFGSALKDQEVDDFVNFLKWFLTEKQYPEEFGAKVYKITRDEQNARLTHMKITGGVLRNRMQITEEEKVNQIRLYSGTKYSSASEVTAGMVCAVLGLENTVPGQCLGAESSSILPMLEPVLTYRLILPNGDDPVKLLPKLRQLEEEDPQLHIVWNEHTQEIRIQVMGQVQIEILQNMIRDRYGVETAFGTGDIIYKETIANTVEGVGHFEPLRHYAEVHLILEPGAPGSGIECIADCSEDILDRNWQRLILTHLTERSHRGVLTGSQITDIRITVASGRAHIKHTEGGDFRQATYRAVRQGLMQAQSILLEPVYRFLLEVPQESIGRAMMDLERMSAKFSLDMQDGVQVLVGTVPVATLGDYQREVSSYTRGLGRMSLELSGYEPCHNTQEVLLERNYDPDADLRNPASSVFCAHGAGFVVPWEQVFDYMHVESVLYAKPELTMEEIMLQAQREWERRDEALGTEEIDDIIRKTFYANSRGGDTGKKKVTVNAVTKVYKGKEKPFSKRKQYLLVDGYNIIHAWKELRELAMDNIDGARGKLLDILCNYQAIQKCEIIAVFDAYRMQGHPTEILDYHNIHVVYTKEAETADQYIEKFAHEKGQDYHVRVATSDGVEQIIIRGAGCYLVSAREFEAEVKAAEQQLRAEYIEPIRPAEGNIRFMGTPVISKELAEQLDTPKD